METQQHINKDHGSKYVHTETNVDNKYPNTFLQYSRTENDNYLNLGEQEQKRKNYQKRNEIFVISFPYACSNPRTMVIELLNTSVTVVTV